MRKSTYLSCNCRQCKLSSPRVKRFWKRHAHRKLRRETRAAIREGRVPPQAIAGLYRA